MKRLIFFGISLLVLVSPSFSFAKSSSTTEVNTVIEGSGTVSTHTETTVNGHTEVFDSNQPGDYTIHMEDDGTTSTTSNPTKEPTITTTQIATPSVIPTIIKKTQWKNENIFITVLTQIKNIFAHIFHKK